MTNVINSPTRLNALLDPVIVILYMFHYDSGVMDVLQNISYHKAAFITSPFCFRKHLKGKFGVNFEELNQKLQNHDWNI